MVVRESLLVKSRGMMNYLTKKRSTMRGEDVYFLVRIDVSVHPL